MCSKKDILKEFEAFAQAVIFQLVSLILLQVK